MAKKNRKNVKINQKIKHYFDGDPFDVGIVRVESSTLSELFATLGIYDIEHNKDALLKVARMLWSEADGTIRRDILDFFVAHDVVYPSDKEKKPIVQKEEKLKELLQEFEDITPQEELALQEAFYTARTKKITPQKIESKLKHIRLTNKRKELEIALDGIFDIDDSFEFNASLRFAIFEYHFHKILTLNTPSYEDSFLQESSIEEIKEKITTDKEKTIEKKQQEINNFLSSIPQKHTYLTKQEIVSALRTAPPKSSTKLIPLKESILFSLIETQLDIYSLEIKSKELLIGIEESISLPHSTLSHTYRLDLHIELETLLEVIWYEKPLDFTSVIAPAKAQEEEEFLTHLHTLVEKCAHYSTLLHLSEEELHKMVYSYLLELIPNSLHISAKVMRKTERIFLYHIQEQLVKHQRQALLARTIRDFKNLFPMARSMQRKLILHIGPTNSGKTYNAMQKLKNADTGYYLAPLRLLALEGYEDIQAHGISASLITGEEQIVDEDATHISSTIEMLNFEVDVDVCVIDEVQMIDDSERGWAWANAIIGAPAHEIIMTGSANVKDAIIALAEYLGEELEIVEHKRKTPLTLLEHPTDVEDVKEQTAIIAFSRREVLRLKQNFSRYFDVSVVYGNLSPEVRREEARRFREKETQILIATDAIAMGMNLPIETVLFSKAQKFDGIRERQLLPSEVAQISGRAGRYGISEHGYVGALSKDVLKIVRKNFHKEIPPVTIPFKVMANLEHIKLVSSILEEQSLEEILKFFVKNMKFNGPFRATNLEDMLEASAIVDKYELDIAMKYHLACAPLTLKSEYIVGAFERYIEALVKKESVHYKAPKLSGDFALTTDDLLHAEDMVKEISLYLWLSYRFGEYFVDAQKARTYRGVLNKYIERSLHQTHFVQTCKICGAPLPKNSKYAICEKCFKKNYTHQRTHSRPKPKPKERNKPRRRELKRD
jgi:ATP-dependent RNA helicase SUPV3L1/SUV3